MSYDFKKWKPMLLNNKEVNLNSISYKTILHSNKLDGCLHGNSKLITPNGRIKIKDIVDNKKQTEVLSFNEKTNNLEFKKVTNWFINGKANNKNFIQLKIGREKLICTKNHKILTNNGWKEANNLKQGYDKLLKRELNKIQKSIILASLFGDGSVSKEKRHTNGGFRLLISNKEKEYVKHKADSIGIPYKLGTRISGYKTLMITYYSTVSNDYGFNFFNVNNNIRTDHITAETIKSIMTPAGLSVWYCDDGSITYNNKNKNTPIIYLHTQGHTKKQVSEFVRYFNLLGMKPSIYIDKSVKTTPGQFLRFSTIDSFKFLEIIKNDCFKGKEYKFKDMCFKYHQPTILSTLYTDFEFIKFWGTNYTNKYDIEVEDNHTYVASNIVVHNCRIELTNKGVYGRSLKPINNINIQTKFKTFCETLPDNIIVEAELWSPELECRKISGIATSDNHEVIESLNAYCFDLFDFDGNSEFGERIKTLRKLIKAHDGKEIVMIQQTPVANENHLLGLHEKCLSEGGEGSVIKDWSKKYKKGRVTIREHIGYKLKKYVEEDYEIIGVNERFLNTNESQKNELGRSFKRNTVNAKQPTGIAATFTVKLHNGKEGKVTLTGTEDERREIWVNKEFYVGQYAVVHSMATGVMDKLRHPVLKSIKHKVEK